MGTGRYLLAIALVLAVALPLGTIVTAASLVAKTNKTMYIPGEEVVVSGKASPGAVVTIKVVGPKGPVAFDQVKAGADGSFKAVVMKFPEKPSDMIPYGKYKVIVLDSITLEKVELEIEFVGFGVKGVVVDEEGKPVANACVELTIDGTVVKTETGNDGSFVIYATKVGTATLRVTKAGYLSKELSVTIEAGKIIDVGKIVLESLENVLKELSSKVTSLETKVKGLETAFSAIDKDLKDIKETLNNVNKVVKDVASTLKTLEESISKTIDEKLGEVSKKLDEVLTNVAKASADVAMVKSDIASLKSDVSALSSKIDTMESTVKAIKDVSGSVSTVQTLVIIALILSLIAAASSIYGTIQLSKKLAG